MVSSWPPPGGAASSTARRRRAARRRPPRPPPRSPASAASRPSSVCDRDAQAASATPRVAERHGRTPPSRPSGPATTPSSGATSSTERASGADLRPRVAERADLAEVVEDAGDRHAAGGRLERARAPQKWAGRRTLAPESVPKPHGEQPAAIAAASPPLAAAGRALEVVRVVRAAVDLVVGLDPAAVGGAVRLAEQDRAGRPHAARRRSRRAPATTPPRSGAPIAISIPAASRLSLTVNGTPCSGPTGSPRASAASASRARASARRHRAARPR